MNDTQARNYFLANEDPDLWLMAQSHERSLVMVRRALRSIDLYDETEDGAPIVPDEDTDEYEDFVFAFMQEANRLMIDDVMVGMIENNLIEIAGVTEDGDRTFSLTDRGKQIVASEGYDI